MFTRIWYAILVAGFTLGVLFAPMPAVMIDSKFLTIRLSIYKDFADKIILCRVLFVTGYGCLLLFFISVIMQFHLEKRAEKRFQKKVRQELFSGGITEAGREIFQSVTRADSETMDKLFGIKKKLDDRDLKKLFSYYKSLKINPGLKH